MVCSSRFSTVAVVLTAFIYSCLNLGTVFISLYRRMFVVALSLCRYVTPHTKCWMWKYCKISDFSPQAWQAESIKINMHFAWVYIHVQCHAKCGKDRWVQEPTKSKFDQICVFPQAYKNKRVQCNAFDLYSIVNGVNASIQITQKLIFLGFVPHRQTFLYKAPAEQMTSESVVHMT